MRLDDRARWQEVGSTPASSDDGAYDAPYDAAVYDRPVDMDLEPVDASLRAAGARARVALRSRTQPTRYFETELRRRLLASVDRPASSR